MFMAYAYLFAWRRRGFAYIAINVHQVEPLGEDIAEFRDVWYRIAVIVAAPALIGFDTSSNPGRANAANYQNCLDGHFARSRSRVRQLSSDWRFVRSSH